MVHQRLYAGLIILTLSLGAQPAFAGDGGNLDAKEVSKSAVIPADGGNKSPFTFSAALREIYDDNIFTTKTGKIDSFKTDLSPSVLFDYKMEDSEFSARYTFHVTYFTDRPGNKFDYTHEFVTQYQHNFSDRFSFNAAEQFRHFTEPSSFEGTGTPYRSGAYFSNVASLGFNAQWTPLFGTISNFTNTIIHYDGSAIGATQNNIENTGSETLTFAVLPKITLVAGGIIDDISYDHINRGYTSYTGNTGADWQALPSLSLGARIGGTVVDTDGAGGDEVTPYAAFTLNWKLGARSSLAFNYSHEVVPTDVSVAAGQEADRLDALFKYDITPDITAHFEGTLTLGDYSQDLLAPGTVASFDEQDYALDTGLTYHLDNHFDIDLGYIFSGISSDQSFREYDRNQVYVGIRGTY